MIRKRRYLSRLRRLVYKLSKIRSLDEFMRSGAKALSVFERALNTFAKWLRKRGCSPFRILHNRPH
ncbi:MAG: hypothetical protein DRO12_05315 [Thermoprotei archaeon]|nr:MAG: hypothetical protein DRO12_05315 [Thermoprotei archaeon]